MIVIGFVLWLVVIVVYFNLIAAGVLLCVTVYKRSRTWTPLLRVSAAVLAALFFTPMDFGPLTKPRLMERSALAFSISFLVAFLGALVVTERLASKQRGKAVAGS